MGTRSTSGDGLPAHVTATGAAGGHRPPLEGTQDAFFPRAMAAEMPTIVAGEGIHLVDDRGRRLLDVASGPFLANLGQGNERVLQAMHDQGRRLSYTYSRTTRHPANARLSAQLAALAGPGFERVHLTSGGSDAVEMALKFLRQHAVATGQPERHRVISLMPGFHGSTVQTLGLNGDLAVPALWGPLTVSSEKIPAPLTFRAESPEAAAAASIAALEEAILRLGPDQVLAFVMEPIGGQSTGVNVPHPSFARDARRVCDRYGVRLVFDEVVTAFRTGRFLAMHHDPDVRPDAIVVAKGLASGYAPLGAFLAPASLVDPLAGSTGFIVSHSYDANPMACAAGSAVLDEVVDRDLIGNAERMGARIRAGLEQVAARHPLVGDVRGRGLLLGIELVADPVALARFPAEVDSAAIVRRHGLDHGLLFYARRQNAGLFGDWLLITPPLVIDEAGCDELLAGIDATLTAAAPEILGRLAALAPGAGS